MEPAELAEPDWLDGLLSRVLQQVISGGTASEESFRQHVHVKVPDGVIDRDVLDTAIMEYWDFFGP